LEETS